MAPIPCRDGGWLVIQVQDEVQWQGLRRVVGTALEGFGDLQDRLARIAELDAALTGWTAERSAEDAMLALQDEGAAAGLVRDSKDLNRDAHRSRARCLEVYRTRLRGRDTACCRAVSHRSGTARHRLAVPPRSDSTIARSWATCSGSAARNCVISSIKGLSAPSRACRRYVAHEAADCESRRDCHPHRRGGERTRHRDGLGVLGGRCAIPPCEAKPTSPRR